MEKIQLEYIFKASPPVLFNRISNASGLSEWFADNVIIKGNRYIFVWDGAEQEAEIIQQKPNEFVRFRWIEEDESYFEFRITKDELTGDVAFIITDFVEEEDKDDTIKLWNSQVSELKHTVGS
jgi:uncharacterized protein YndB with AHSA1/START domain